jgi:hypothetical protein
MNKTIALAATAVGLAAVSAPTQAQTVYGELGYSAMSARLNVPLLGVSAKADPAMARAVLGVSPLGGLTIEGLAAGHLSDDRFHSQGNMSIDGHAKINQILGIYVGARVGLGPVELYGRVGQARSEMRFKGLGSESDSDVSYGGGLRLIPGKHLTFSADYMRYYDKGGARLDGYTLSVGYRF